MDQPNDTVTVRKIEEALGRLRSSLTEGHVVKGSLNEAIQIFLHSIVSRIASRVPNALRADKMQVAPAGVGEPFVAAEGYTKGDLAIEWYCLAMEQFNTSPPGVLALLNYKDAMMSVSTDVRFEVSILEPAERLVDKVVKHLSEL
jgi:hypothetical protein